MKHNWILSLTLTCALLLSACGGGSKAAVWTGDHAQDILDSGAFSEELEELNCDTAWMLYGLAESGLAREALTGGTVFRSAGATCEELAVLTFDSGTSAQTAVDTLETYIQNQIASNRDYRPAEIPKLENKWLERRDKTVLLAVANDLDAAQRAVEGEK